MELREIDRKRKATGRKRASVPLPDSWQPAGFMALKICESNCREKNLKRTGNHDTGWMFSRDRPSLRMRNCSVDRFMPNRTAAPLGPATTQFVCDNTLRICF